MFADRIGWMMREGYSQIKIKERRFYRDRLNFRLQIFIVLYIEREKLKRI